MPEPVKKCTFVASSYLDDYSRKELDVACESGWDGGLPTNYTVQVDVLNTSSKYEINRLREVVLPFVGANKVVNFHIKGLLSNATYIITIFSVNDIGRSSGVTHHYEVPHAVAGKPVLQAVESAEVHEDQMKYILIMTVVGLAMIAGVGLAIGAAVKLNKKIDPPYDFLDKSVDYTAVEPPNSEQRSYVHYRNGVYRVLLHSGNKNSHEKKFSMFYLHSSHSLYVANVTRNHSFAI